MQTAEATFVAPSQDLAAAAGAFLLAYAQVEHALLYALKAVNGWPLDHAVDWGAKKGWKALTRRRDLEAALFGKRVPAAHEGDVLEALVWLAEHHRTRQVLAHGALVSFEGGEPFFYFRAVGEKQHGKYASDPALYTRLAQEGLRWAIALDAVEAPRHRGADA